MTDKELSKLVQKIINNKKPRAYGKKYIEYMLDFEMVTVQVRLSFN